MKTIQNTAALLFIAAVAVLSAVAVFGVWDFFSRDVINKSFQTLGLLALVAILVMIAGHFLEGRSGADGVATSSLPSPIFRSIRQITLTVLIASVSLLALLGVLAIWEVIKDKEVLYKSSGSLGILAFGAFVMVMTCLERERKFRPGSHTSIVAIGGAILIFYLLFNMFSSPFFY